MEKTNISLPLEEQTKNVSTPIEEPWRMLEKVPAGDGCVEDPDVAFHLFCGIKPIQFGLYGFHNTPHLGCYSDDYNPFLPILSISQKFSNTIIPDSILRILTKVAEHGLLDDSSLNSLDDSIDVFAFIHSGFKGQKCHHLYCDRTDELISCTIPGCLQMMQIMSRQVVN